MWWRGCGRITCGWIPSLLNSEGRLDEAERMVKKAMPEFSGIAGMCPDPRSFWPSFRIMNRQSDRVMASVSLYGLCVFVQAGLEE